MHRHSFQSRRIVGGLVAVLSLTAVLALGVIPRPSWRPLLRDDLEVSMVWHVDGATAQGLERDALRPMEAALATLGAEHLVGSAHDGGARLTAMVPGESEAMELRARLEREASALGGAAGAPAVAVARATADLTIDVMRMLIALALALAIPTLLASIEHHEARSATAGRASPVRRCVWRRVDAILDRFQDALAILLRHRRRIAPVVLVVVASVLVAATARSVALPSYPSAPSPAPTVRIEIYGEDLQTLAGVALHAAAEARQLPGVVRAEVVQTPGAILRVDGVRATRIEVLTGGHGGTLGDTLRATIGAALLGSGHHFRIDGESAIGSATLATVAVVLAGTCVLLLTLALRHGDWIAPATIAAGIPLVIAGAALAGVARHAAATRWWWLGAMLPVIMLARQGSALLLHAERGEASGLQLHVALIAAARAALRPLLLVTTGQLLVLAPFAMLGGAHVAGAALAAIGGLFAVVGAVAFLAPVTYESATQARARWRAARLARQLERRLRP